MFMSYWFYKLIKMILSMCLAKLSEIEKKYLVKLLYGVKN